MSITEALLDGLEGDAPVGHVLVGAFWTAVVLDLEPIRCGLASTLRGATHHHGPPIPEAGSLLECSARELAQWLAAPEPLKASVGLAAYNALLDVDEIACDRVNASQVILGQGAGRRVAVVGHFPFVDAVREAAEVCWVLELNPRPGDVPADRADELLPQADVVALTSTSLINHSFDELVNLCRPDSLMIMLGPSTPLSPVLLDAGVDVLSGTRVVEPELVLRSISEGATFRQIKRRGGLNLLTMRRTV
ncbi:MAG: Rossmann-like domain-containing protein [Chloroflexota bacterium]